MMKTRTRNPYRRRQTIFFRMCREGLLQLWESWVPRGRTVQNPAVADQVFATEYTQKTCRLKLAAIPPAKLWKVVTTGSRLSLATVYTMYPADQ